MSLAYIVSKGNVSTTIIWFAITTDATAGLSDYKEKQWQRLNATKERESTNAVLPYMLLLYK